MDSRTIERLAASLCKGELPEAQPWDIAAAVRLIVDKLAGSAVTVSVDEVRAVAKVLNQHLHFDHTRMLGQEWLDRRGFDATVTKLHAQALINLTALDAAEELLRVGLKTIRQSDAGLHAATEAPEYEGLMGRVFKQRYILTGNRDLLAEATRLYRSEFERTSYLWHGINVAALLARQDREGVPGVAVAATQFAQTIYDQLAKRLVSGTRDPWDAAIASEASLALERCDEAELWLYRFLHHPKVKPFDVRSYSRQIREIWQGDPAVVGNCADRLAGIMSRHIVQTERCLSVNPSAIAAMTTALEKDPGAFEKNFSGEGTFSLDAIRCLLRACSSIGCVCNLRGERLGTGFLIAGNKIKETFGPGPVFITNAHVISDTVPNAIHLADVRVTFEVECTANSEPKFYKAVEVLFTSAPGDLGIRRQDDNDLDVTIVRLEPSPEVSHHLNMAEDLPLVHPKTKAFVVGHPRGSGLQISLNDSVLLDIDDEGRLVHYRTPTDPGSSGSPVFNSQWEVIALHHGGFAATPRLHGSGYYEANEGIALSAIRRKLNV